MALISTFHSDGASDRLSNSPIQVPCSSSYKSLGSPSRSIRNDAKPPSISVPSTVSANISLVCRLAVCRVKRIGNASRDLRVAHETFETEFVSSGFRMDELRIDAEVESIAPLEDDLIKPPDVGAV